MSSLSTYITPSLQAKIGLGIFVLLLLYFETGFEIINNVASCFLFLHSVRAYNNEKHDVNAMKEYLGYWLTLCSVQLLFWLIDFVEFEENFVYSVCAMFVKLSTYYLVLSRSNGSKLRTITRAIFSISALRFDYFLDMQVNLIISVQDFIGSNVLITLKNMIVGLYSSVFAKREQRID